MSDDRFREDVRAALRRHGHSMTADDLRDEVEWLSGIVDKWEATE